MVGVTFLESFDYDSEFDSLIIRLLTAEEVKVMQYAASFR
jgi:hypothetical protein